MEKKDEEMGFWGVIAVGTAVIMFCIGVVWFLSNAVPFLVSPWIHQEQQDSAESQQLNKITQCVGHSKPQEYITYIGCTVNGGAAQPNCGKISTSSIPATTFAQFQDCVRDTR